jgi:hypothetical protein
MNLLGLLTFLTIAVIAVALPAVLAIKIGAEMLIIYVPLALVAMMVADSF